MFAQLEEARLKAEDDSCCSVDCVSELRSLRHLEHVIDSDASSIVVVAFYSRVSGTAACSCMRAESGARRPLHPCQLAVKPSLTRPSV